MRILKRSVLVTIALLFISVQAFAEAGESPLRRVETEKVCMVNNTVFEKPQIPVEVEGKTYYGCCEMCKATLANKAEARSAIDPSSGKSVDKANAVIAATNDGKVLYFESEANFEKFSSSMQ